VACLGVTSLRKRFERVKAKLKALMEEEGLLDES
jgi:hypothetical protein